VFLRFLREFLEFMVEKRWRVGGRGDVLAMGVVDGQMMCSLVSWSLPLYTFFHFWRREADGGRGFSFPLSALSAHGLFPTFLLSQPFFTLCCKLASQVGLFPLW
jgi:hypothetical protein